jgi:CO/xanthine dehydrogenase FAD-binding subunit
VARRLPALERALVGGSFDAGLADRVELSQLAPLSPIDDVRGSATYRVDAALVLLRRLLSKVAA